MSSMTYSDGRIHELAAGFAIGDLSEPEIQEIKALDQDEFAALLERYERTAARAYLTFQSDRPMEQIPVELSARLKRMAQGYLSEPNLLPNPAGLNPTKVQTTDSEAQPKVTIAPPTVNFRELVAWFCVAASIALALCVWLPGSRETAMTAQAMRDKLIASASDLIRVPFEATTPDQSAPKELGEVVWSNATQEGYMTIRGLPKNDATKEQYQLWIIDPSRDEKPVDGGVFDIVDASEAIVPIRAKLRVDQPTVFAITVEKPGGVVVSDQKRLPLLAKVK